VRPNAASRSRNQPKGPGSLGTAVFDVVNVLAQTEDGKIFDMQSIKSIEKVCSWPTS